MLAELKDLDLGLQLVSGDLAGVGEEDGGVVAPDGLFGVSDMHTVAHSL